MRIEAELTEAARRLLPIYVHDVGTNHTQERTQRRDGLSLYQFLAVLEGEGCFEAGGVCIPLVRGCVVFTRKRSPHAYYPTEGVLRTAWVTFDGYGAESLLSYLQAEEYAVLSDESICMQVPELYRLMERNASHEAASGALYALTVAFFQACNRARRSPVLLQAIAYLEEHYASDISVEAIAAAVDVSPSLLFRCFREEGSTPTQRLREIRLRHAKQLLSDGSIRICDVASRCGFSDTAYFCKLFRRELGITPGQYRRSCLI